MPDMLRYAGQVIFFVAVAAVTGYLASWPIYHQVPEDKAQIKLSFAHGGARKVDCRRLTASEIAALPPRERRPNTCSRERIPIRVQLSLNGEILYDEELSPTGLSGDGPARTYRKFLVTAGDHVIVARMRDSKRTEGFDYEATHEVSLEKWQNLAIDFKADTGGFQFR